MGNHDSPLWAPRVFAAQGSPRLLLNEIADIGPLVLAGIDSVAYAADVHGTLARIPPGRPVLLLLHEGDSLQWNHPPSRPLLALAGHTHGGQVVLPLIGSLGDLLLHPTPCRRGACTLNRWPLFVTSGVGTSWVPLRIGVPPEIVLLTLTP
jgi:predicted MPP superfamily phosphohydrolase